MVSCQIQLQYHKFNTIGEFEGEAVFECEFCKIRLVGYEERWVGKPWLVVDLKENRLIFNHGEGAKKNLVCPECGFPIELGQVHDQETNIHLRDRP